MRGHGRAKPRVIAGRFSRKERQFHRAKIDLEDAALTDQTRTRYYLALRKIIRHVEKATHEDQLDSYLCLWIKKMWKTGEPLLTVGDALSALHFYLRIFQELKNEDLRVCPSYPKKLLLT